MESSRGRIVILSRVYQTCLAMLQSRGYTLSSAQQDDLKLLPLQIFSRYSAFYNINESQYLTLFTTYLLRQQFRHSVTGKIIQLYYSAESNVEAINKMADATLSEDRSTEIDTIFITRGPLKARNAKDKLISIKQIVTHFREDQLLLDPTRSVFASPHQQLTADDEKKLFTRTVQPGQLPEIHSDDPVISFYGWKPGSTVRVTQLNLPVETLGKETLTYRHVTGPYPKDPNKQRKPLRPQEEEVPTEAAAPSV